MFKIFPIVFLIISISNSSAQMCPCAFNGKSSDKILRNEIGFNLVSINEILINFTSANPVYMTNYAKGFMLKHHFDNFSIRAGFDYFENSYKFELGESSNYNINTGKNNGKNYCLGVEKTYINKFIQVYFAADFTLSVAKYNGISEGVNNSKPYYNIPYQFKSKAFGISPGMGIRYRPFNHFSINIETAISILKYKTSDSDAYPSEKNIAVIYLPLRLFSLNFHFK